MRLRHIAQVNPPSPAFDRLSDDADISFLRMESVWPKKWHALGEVRRKSDVLLGFTRFQDGDILVPKITPTFEASRSILVDGLSSGAGAGTTELHVVRPGHDVYPLFLMYLMHSHSFLRFGEAEMYGVAGQKRVPDEFLRDLEVWVPGFDEQQRIAGFLDAEVGRIDQLQVARRRQLGLLEEKSRVLVDHEIDRLVSNSGVVAFRRIIRSIEQGSSPQCDAVPAGLDEWGVLKLSSIKSGKFHPSENKRMPGGVEVDARFRLSSGDLLITRANTPELVGDAAVVCGEVGNLLLSDLVYRVDLGGQMNADYVCAVIRGSRVRGHIQAAARGSSRSMVKLRGEDIRSWEIPAASRKEQMDFVARVKNQLDVTGWLRSKIERQIRLLEERKRALITAAVTGQIDVTTVRGADVS
ncbi:restriction endonuclease subunit S [Nocardiopsis alba]|uniref:restriction endonuclease subunit S n=1 Tax=Nocardiopsis alba TaxID=53437 RepID=UPI0011D22D7D|nr:hypothetical protein [Nocardiopsis alba]